MMRAQVRVSDPAAFGIDTIFIAKDTFYNDYFFAASIANHPYDEGMGRSLS
jgi:hypothetical protein